MTIIAERLVSSQPLKVNPSARLAVVHSIHSSAQEPREDSPEYKAWRRDVVVALRRAGKDKLADDFDACSGVNARFALVKKEAALPSNLKAVYVCEENPAHHAEAVCFTCHCRACPECARRASARLMARYVPHIVRMMERYTGRYKLRKIVLTTPVDLRQPDAPALVRQLLDCVPRFFDKLLSKGWRKDRGYLLAAEFGADGMKLHFHLLVFSEFISNKREDGYPMATAWTAVTGGSCQISRIYAVNRDKLEDEIAETVKYTTKLWKRDPDGNVIRFPPELIPTFLQCLQRTRRIRSVGVFYNIGATPRETPVCKQCNAFLERWTPMDWEIYVATGWTPPEYDEALRFKHGNKSEGDKGQQAGNDPPALVQTSLFGDYSQNHYRNI